MIFLLAASLSAQTMNTGTLLGTVKDPSGAAVPEVSIRIQRANPPFERQLTTDAGGNYFAPQVPVGTYQVTFEKTGFQKTIHNQIELSAGQSLRVDTTLTLGSVCGSRAGFRAGSAGRYRNRQRGLDDLR